MNIKIYIKGFVLNILHFVMFSLFIFNIHFTFLKLSYTIISLINFFVFYVFLQNIIYSHPIKFPSYKGSIVSEKIFNLVIICILSSVFMMDTISGSNQSYLILLTNAIISLLFALSLNLGFYERVNEAIKIKKPIKLKNPINSLQSYKNINN